MKSTAADVESTASEQMFFGGAPLAHVVLIMKYFVGVALTSCYNDTRLSAPAS